MISTVPATTSASPSQAAGADPDVVQPEPAEPVGGDRGHELGGDEQRHDRAGAERAHRDQAGGDDHGATEAADELHRANRAHDRRAGPDDPAIRSSNVTKTNVTVTLTNAAPKSPT